MTDPRAAKDAARAQARARRDSLSDDRMRAFAADVLRDRFLEELVRPGFLPDGPVAGYWPLGSELDVRPLLLHLKTGGLRTGGLKTVGRPIALPVSGPRGQALTFRDWDPALPLAAGRYGIQEPGADRPEVVPAVLLVPMLAFDRSGHRLGYGAGYYDRTLDALRAIRPVLAVGMAFAAQEMDAVPHGAHDERLDWILTERETLRFAQ
ncbi:5-formyltetrahydrofolate cyclo-ligase [Azospirillum brasilense]|uniref:5-formyltetrahydrofolate cyclo-ligase n=1 Tax=Azospirillum brasilense TaxID=192 RepID=UPI00190A08F3|nr:5-formyltetrahydrofolate cyclo-ligase [Azospirillum brasilense]MBK3736630.1 5-formyltetrahydrofolate cyclo-ligase [Azospirillum brasilense]